VIFVAPLHGVGRLVPVAYYTNARFETEYTDRPEYHENSGFERAPNGNKHVYNVSARLQDCRLIPIERRPEFKIPGDRFRRTPILYARSPNHSHSWRRRYAAIADRILADFSEARVPRHRFPQGGGGFGDPARNRRIEHAAIAATKRYLHQRGYRGVDEKWKKEKCGYDLRVWRLKQPQTELIVEVKGTEARVPAFIMTAGEHAARLDPRWRFSVVTTALSEPRVILMRRPEFDRAFVVTPLVFRGVLKD
jgi:uncharacterized protein DUF3883